MFGGGKFVGKVWPQLRQQHQHHWRLEGRNRREVHAEDTRFLLLKTARPAALVSLIRYSISVRPIEARPVTEDFGRAEDNVAAGSENTALLSKNRFKPAWN